MNNKLKRILKHVLLISVITVFVGCSSRGRNSENDPMFGGEDYAQALVSNIKPKWFKGSRRFKLEKMDGSVSVNTFFDVSPNINIKQKTLKFVVSTPEDSSVLYGIDVPTGQHYFKKFLCKQKDITNKYFNDIEKPNFTEGIVPRYLDQLGEPQKIIVYGDKNYYQAHYLKNYFDARVIGGYVELFCPKGRCLTDTEWRSRLVLVAVQDPSEKYKEVKNIDELKSVIDWKYTQAFIENGYGNNKIAGQYFSAFKVGALVSAKEAIGYMSKKSIFFSINKMKSMRMGCFKLYDHLWEHIGKISKEKIPKTLKEVKEKALSLKGSSKLLRSRNRRFYKRFGKFFAQYHNDYKTCSRFVYPASINDNAQRHWFFTYVNAVSHLHTLGYYYNCGRNSWFKNPIIESGKRMKSVEDEYRFCSERAVDNSMDYAILKLKVLREKKKESYRYIEYDKGLYGTHNKIFSWVRSDNKELNCVGASNDSKGNHLQSTFPADIRWKKRATEGKTKSAVGEIIY